MPDGKFQRPEMILSGRTGKAVFCLTTTGWKQIEKTLKATAHESNCALAAVISSHVTALCYRNILGAQHGVEIEYTVIVQINYFL